MEPLPKRKHTRLEGYDYGQNGVYFVTLCTAQRRAIFGCIRPDGALVLSAIGEIAKAEIENISLHRPNVSVLHSVVMPNHIHMLLLLQTNPPDMRRDTTCRVRPCAGNAFGALKKDSLPTIIGAYKAAVTRRLRQPAATTSRGPTPVSASIWQPRYHDHIVRNDADCQRIWRYIDNNPAQWAQDTYYVPPQHIKRTVSPWLRALR